jgi:hypothetical protein
VVITQWGDVATPDCHLWRAGDAGAEALTAEGACVEEPSWDRSTVARERVRVSWRLLALMPRSTPADSGRAADAASCAMGGGLCAGASTEGGDGAAGRERAGRPLTLWLCYVDAAFAAHPRSSRPPAGAHLHVGGWP